MRAFEEKAYAEELEALRAKFGLNQPPYIQYFTWPGRVLRGDLEEVLWTKRPVLEEVTRRLPVSFELGAMAITLTVMMGTTCGLPGMGHSLVDAIDQRDYPVVQGVTCWSPRPSCSSICSWM